VILCPARDAARSGASQMRTARPACSHQQNRKPALYGDMAHIAFIEKASRLYEQERRAASAAASVEMYVMRWERWAVGVFGVA
jgi:hypothetical protein